MDNPDSASALGPMTAAGLRRIRARLRLSQPQMAEELGVDANTVSRMERGDVAISATMEKLARLLLATKAEPVSGIETLLHYDEQNERATRRFFDQFTPQLMDTLSMAESMYPALTEPFSQSATDDDDQREIKKIVRQTGLANDRELHALMTEGSKLNREQRRAAAQARGVLDRVASRYVRGILLVYLGRSYMFAATDLLRLRITSNEGSQRLQAEAIALMQLFLENPYQAQRWHKIRTDADGLRFYSKHQTRLNEIMAQFRLDGAYERGSAAAFHVRIASVARGFEHRTFREYNRQVNEIRVKFQEADFDHPELLLIHTVGGLLRTQERIFAALPQVVPEIDDRALLDDAIPNFRMAVDQLWLRVVRAFPEIERRWTETTGLELGVDGIVRKKA